MKTAVEWLVEQFEKYYVFRDLKNTIVYQQAKAMEANVATEYAEFCIRCDRASLKQVKFEDWKKSWDETFKQQEQ
jgi:hypothetical protein